MGKSKENDLILNMLENPDFSLLDFQNVGLNTNNTSLELENTYISSPLIYNNPNFLKNDGSFDNVKFHDYYLTATLAYNYMSKSELGNLDNFKATFSKYNIFAPASQRDMSQQFEIVRVPNPDRVTESMIRIGEEGPRKKTPAELAQSEKTYDVATNTWTDSPEDSFFSSDVRVLAQYDEDEDSTGKTAKDEGFNPDDIVHRAGELKINPDTGTYYYETLNGRNIRGRQVLHLSDIITKEDSPLNAVDFLDSDDVYKSPIGNFVKNAALVGSMFIPYVGPVITGATILQQAMGLGATLGKMALGSQHPTMNYLEGLSETTDILETRSEYAQLNTWCLENLLGMIGTTVAQLKQQRMLFEQAPRLFGKSGSILKEEGQAAFKKGIMSKYAAENEAKIVEKFGVSSSALAKTDGAAWLKATQELEQNNAMKAAEALEKYMESYYNVGGRLSKAYMTMLTVNDIYGEAIEAGASRLDAGLLTAGYAAMEYALLSTGLGEWVLPELRASRLKNKAVLRALTEDLKRDWAIESAAATTTAAKHKYFQKVIDFGKKLFKADYAVGKQGIFSATAASTFAAALGEGTEEVSEDILGDFSRAMFNAAQELHIGTSGDTRLYNEDWQNQYLLDFIGGAIGGGIANVSLDFKNVRAYLNMTYNQAAQELVSMQRNKKDLEQFNKLLNSTTLGDANLSATKRIVDPNDPNKTIGWEQGDANDNQDKAIKDMVRLLMKTIANILEADGADVSDKSLFEANTLKDLRYSYLYNTTTAGKLIQDFNSLAIKAIGLHKELNALNSPAEKMAAGEGDQKGEESIELESRREKLKNELKEVQQQIQDIRDGKKAALFMASALLESSPYVLKPFMQSATFLMYAEQQTGKKWDEITEGLKENLKDLYTNYLKTQKKDDVAISTGYYLNITRAFKKNLEAIVDAYSKMAENQEVLEQINGLRETLDALNYTETGEQRSEDEWLEEAQKLLSTVKMDEKLKQELEDLRYAYSLYLDGNPEGPVQIENPETHVITQATAIGPSTYIQSISKKLEDKTADEIISLANLFIKTDSNNGLGYIPVELRSPIANLLEQTAKILEKQVNYYAMAEDTMDDMMGSDVTEEDLLKISETSERLKTVKEQLKQINDSEKLPNAPILQALDEFNLSITGEPIFFSGLMEQLMKLELTSKSDITQFLPSEDLTVALGRAESVLDQFISVIEGSRTDNAEFSLFKDNIWGINKTLNDAAKLAKDSAWEELPTTKGETADALITDAITLRKKLQYYKTLYGINSGQKLNMQTRVANNLAYILHKKLHRLVDSLPDDLEKDKLEQVLNNSKILEGYYLDKNNHLSLSREEQIQLRREQAAINDALFDFFQDKMDDPAKLAQLLNPNNFIFNTSDYKMINDVSDDIDDHSFVTWLAINAAVHHTTFLKAFKKLPSVYEGKVAPLDSQIMGVQLAVANAINGNVISKFSEAMKAAMVNHFLNLEFDKRVEFLKKSGMNDVDAKIFSTDAGSKYFVNNEFINKYSNITFIEGIPGAGKTSAVLKLAGEYLKTYYPDVVKNALVVNTSNKTALELRQQIGLPDAGEDFNKGREELLQYIGDYTEPARDGDGNYKIESSDVVLIDDGEIYPKWDLKNVTNIPSIIFIDEVSRYTALELAKINEFAKLHGISVIVSGDLDQSQSHGQYKFEDDAVDKIIKEIKEKKIKDDLGNPLEKHINKKDGIIYLVEIKRHSMLHVPKLGSSIRTENVQQDKNQKVVQTALHQLLADPSYKVELELSYYQDDKKITGTKIYTAGLTKRVGDGKDATYFLTLSDERVTQILQDIDTMLANLEEGEKIGYIYHNENSKLYEALMSQPRYKDRIELYKGNSAQGKEGKYWIIENNPAFDTFNYMLDVYTGITRAKVASILVVPASYPEVNNRISAISSKRDSMTQEQSLGKTQIERFSRKYVEIMDEALGSSEDVTVLEYVPRTVAIAPPRGGMTDEELRKKEEERRKKEEEDRRKREEEERERLEKEARDKKIIIHETNRPLFQSYLNRCFGVNEFKLMDKGDDDGFFIGQIDGIDTLSTPLQEDLVDKAWVEENFGTGYTVYGIKIEEDETVSLVAVTSTGEILYNVPSKPGKTIEQIFPSRKIFTPEEKAELEKLEKERKGHEREAELKELIKNAPLSIPKEEIEWELIGDHYHITFKSGLISISSLWWTKYGKADDTLTLEQLTKMTDEEWEEYKNILINRSTKIEHIDYWPTQNKVAVEGVELSPTALEDPELKAIIESLPAIGSDENVEAPVTGKEVQDPKNVAKTIIEQDRQENGEGPSSTINFSKTMTMFMFSDSSYERGMAVNPDGSYKPGSDLRIDSLNGLYNLFKNKRLGIDGNIYNGISGLSDELEILKYMEAKLGQFRKVIFNTPSKQALEEYFQKLLGFKNIYCTFAIKNSESGNNLDASNPYHKFDKEEEQEKIIGKHSEGTKALSPNLRNLVLIIGSSQLENGLPTGDLLEIPLLSLNNPVTLLELENGELHNTYKSAAGEGQEKVRNGLEAVLAKIGNNPAYTGLKNLITLWLRTYKQRTIFFNDDNDWTIAKSLKNLGPQHDVLRGEGYERKRGREEYGQGETLVDLEELASRKDINISPILCYIANDGMIDTEDATIPKATLVTKPGHIFVLYSTHPEYDTTEKMTKLYIKQKIAAATGLAYEPIVKLGYVQSPEISAEEYLESVLNFTMVDKHVPPLGNDRTAFAFLDAILFDKEGNIIEENEKELKELCRGVWGSTTDDKFGKIEGVLKGLHSASEKDQMNTLNSIETWDDSDLGLGSASLKSQLLNVIKQIMAPIVIDPMSGEQHKGKRRDGAKQKLAELFNRTGNKLYFQTKLSKQAINGFIYAETDDLNIFEIPKKGHITIANTKFKVSGNISTNTFLVDESFNQWIADILDKKLRQLTNGQWYSTDNNKYTNHGSRGAKLAEHSGYSKIGKVSAPEISYSSQIIKALNKLPEGLREQFKKEYPPTKANDNDGIRYLVTMLNSTDGLAAFVSSDGTLYTFSDAMFNGAVEIRKADGDSNEVVDGILNKDQEQEDNYYRFVVVTNGKAYDAEFNKKESTLYLTPQDSGGVKAPGFIPVSDDNIETYRELFNTLGKVFDNPPPFIGYIEELLNNGDIDKINQEIEEDQEDLKSYIEDRIREGFTNFGEALDIVDSLVSEDDNYDSCPVPIQIKMI